MNEVKLTIAECKAIYSLIDQLSGGSPENAFSWDGTDDPKDPNTSAIVKIFLACKRNVPKGLEEAL